LLTHKHFIKCLSPTVKKQNLQIRKYDVSMKSPVAKKYLTFPPMEYFLPPKHSLKIL